MEEKGTSNPISFAWNNNKFCTIELNKLKMNIYYAVCGI